MARQRFSPRWSLPPGPVHRLADTVAALSVDGVKKKFE